MSEHPREIWALEATGPDGNCHYTFRVPVRYILTEGEEWDEIWSAAQTHFRSLSEHREELLSYVVEAFIAYFEEPRDE